MASMASSSSSSAPGVETKGDHKANGKALETLHFDNRALATLPIDPETRNFVRQVKGACFSRVKPLPLKNPRLVSASESALQLIDLGRDQIERPDFVEYFSGNRLLPGSDPAAHCYCGHQFGSFAGQLGDGATMYLGEIINSKGERVELQFKGAGKTPYSRTADGRKVLRSSIREFLCSEHMHALGIPTTRAGTCVTSDDRIERDIFYTGNIIRERCTVITRLAPTFLRFGSFEIFKPSDGYTGRAGPSVGRRDILETMLNYTIETFYPDICKKYESAEERYLAFFEEVVRRTARLVALWQCVGWCHGVLNTDNMSIIGVTIDYGPYGFMDRFDPDFICNGSDDQGRYSYANQPAMCRWNCKKLAEAIQMALPLEKSIPVLEKTFDAVFEAEYLSKMRLKLGLLRQVGPDQDEADRQLIKDFMDTMRQCGSDFTNSFRGLTKVKLGDKAAGVGSSAQESKATESSDPALKYLLTLCSPLSALLTIAKPRVPAQQLRFLAMLLHQNGADFLDQFGASPDFILGELEKTKKYEALQKMTPQEKEEKDRAAWSAWLEKYRARLAQEVQGVSAEDLSRFEQERVTAMSQNNPRVVLRNYMAQIAIEDADNDDYREVNRLLRVLMRPYDPALPGDERGKEEKDRDKGKHVVVEHVHETREEAAAEGVPAALDSSKEAPACPIAKAYRARMRRPQADDELPPDWAQDLKVTCSS